MPDQPIHPPSEKFKAEMPRIPGVSSPALKPANTSSPWLLMVGLIAVLVAVFVGARMLSKPRRTEVASPALPQIDVSTPATRPRRAAPAQAIIVRMNPVGRLQHAAAEDE